MQKCAAILEYASSPSQMSHRRSSESAFYTSRGPVVQIRPVSSLYHTSSQGAHSNKCICDWWLAGSVVLTTDTWDHDGDDGGGAHFLLNKTANKAPASPETQRPESWSGSTQAPGKFKGSSTQESQKATTHMRIVRVGIHVPWQWGGPGSAAVFGAEPAWHHPGAEKGRGQTAPPGTASRSRWRQSCWKLLSGAPRTGPALGRHPSHRTAPCPERTGREKSNFLSHFSRCKAPEFGYLGCTCIQKQTFSLVSQMCLKSLPDFLLFNSCSLFNSSCW